MPKMSQIHEELRVPEGHKQTYMHTRTALYRETTSAAAWSSAAIQMLQKKPPRSRASTPEFTAFAVSSKASPTAKASKKALNPLSEQQVMAKAAGL